MPKPPKPEAPRPAGETPGPSKSIDWPGLLRTRSADAALEELGRWMGPDVHWLILTEGENAPVAAEWSRGKPRDRDEQIVEVPCAPGLFLFAGLVPGAVASEERLARAAIALEAWRATRDERARAERRLSARSRELDLLQALGRRSAEARTPAELFETSISALRTAIEFDLVLAGHRAHGPLELSFFLSRSFPDDYLAAVERRARGFLGLSEESGATEPAARVELGDYDPARPSSRVFREEDLVLLPLILRGEPRGCLIVAPAGNLDERQLRLLYSASNQLSLQMERILAVRAAEAGRVRSLVDSMPQGVLLFDAAGKVSDANRSAERMLRLVDRSTADGLDAILAGLAQGQGIETLRQAQRGPRDIEVQVADDRVWNLTLAPLSGDPGRREGAVLVLSDVTARRRIQERLARSEKMSSLGEMISGVAHELNNPLASILGYSQLLQLQGDRGDAGGKLATLAREAERCRKIVQNLLSFARRQEPERKPLSLNQVVTSVLALMRYQLRVDDILVRQELTRDLPLIEGDAHQLEQALVNLLTNARHAVRGTGRGGNVLVRTRVDGAGQVLLEVEDSGPGVPESQRSRIFEPFFTTKQDGKGTGLGLALVFGIVTDHDGTIDVRTGSLGGARFVARFPAGRPALDVKPTPADPLPPAATTGRILIVDDEEPLARMIADALLLDGHETHVVLDARQALDVLGRASFDLVISDLRMPGMDGDELLAEIRRVRPELSEAVLLTTGDTFEDDPETTLAHTGVEVLRKPFDLDDLRRLVRNRLVARSAKR
jgi:signal transduction histidine kinase/ActR/RegA family two-component response regulator